MMFDGNSASVKMQTSGVINLDSSGIASWENNNIVEFVEFFLEFMGIEIKYDEFKNLSKSERISLMRDMKINKILK